MSRNYQDFDMDRDQRLADIAADERSYDQRCAAAADPLTTGINIIGQELRDLQAKNKAMRDLLTKLRSQAVVKRDLACERCENMAAMEWGHVVSLIDQVL
jgi:hypothetical protein